MVFFKENHSSVLFFFPKSSIVCEVNKTVFFYKTYFKTKIHKTITSN